MTVEANTREFVASLTADSHFKTLGQFDLDMIPAPALVAIYAFVTGGGGLTVLKFSKEALEAVDKVVDIIKKCLGKGSVKMELICPDGKTKSTIEGSEKQVIDMMKEFLNKCGRE